MHEVAITYHQADKVVELYLNGERKQFLYFDRAMRLDMVEGQLGCHNTNERVFNGQIQDFYSLLKIPNFRPPQARCSTIQCPSPSKIQKVGPPAAYEIFC